MSVTDEKAFRPMGEAMADWPAEMRFESICHSRFRMPEPPRFHFGTFPADIASHFFNVFGFRRTGSFVCSGLGVGKGYVMTRGDEILCCPEANIFPVHTAHMLQHWRKNAIGDLTVRRVPGVVALLCGPGYEIYGHWLVDTLPKLYILERSGYPIDEIKLLIPDDCPAFGKTMLSLLGVKENAFFHYDPGTELIVPDILVVPTTIHNTFLFCETFADCLRWLRLRIEGQCGSLGYPSADRRVFLSRGNNYNKRPLINRERVEEVAKHFGFEIIAPEALPLIDQWRTCANARIVAGEYGSALHSSMFSSPDTIVCGLRGSALYPGFLQSGIAEATRQPTGYLFGETPEGNHENGFRIDDGALVKCFATLTRPEFSGPVRVAGTNA